MSTQSTQRESVIDRAIGVSKLKPAVFQRIERDPNATSEAAIVVIVVALASAIGGASGGFWGTFVGLASALLFWAIYSGITLFAGRSFFSTSMPATTTYDTVLRLMGYAQAPRVLAVFGIIPIIGWIGVLIGWVLGLITGIYAVRQALKIGLLPAIIVSFGASLFTGIIVGIFSAIVGIPAALF